MSPSREQAEAGKPSWPIGLDALLRECADTFAKIEICNPELLKDAQQTGFVWTRQPGVVCLATSRPYFDLALDNPFVRVVIAPTVAVGNTVQTEKAIVICEDAEDLYVYLHAAQDSISSGEPDVDDLAMVDSSAILRGPVTVMAHARIGPRVVITGPVTVGAGVSIDAGAIIGCEGLYAKPIDGVQRHVPHFGGVIVDEHAFIHAGAVIARSAVKGEATRIGSRAHVGVMVNVGHDAEIGEAAVLSSNCVIAGRARVGARVWVGASATISNMVQIGDDATVRLGAVVIRDVPAGANVSGNFASDHTRVMRSYLKGLQHAP